MEQFQFYCFANVLMNEDRVIQMLVYDITTQKVFILSAIHAPAQEGAKQVFWNHLAKLNSIFDLPWCLIGHFNEMETPEEEVRGSQLSQAKIAQLKHFYHLIICHLLTMLAVILCGRKEFMAT